MTPEARLDRLERIAKLFVRAGVRYRRDLRELGDKLNIMVNIQMRNDERFARTAERFVRTEERLANLSEKTDQRFVQLANAQALTDRKFIDLMEVLRRERNGNPSTGEN